LALIYYKLNISHFGITRNTISYKRLALIELRDSVTFPVPIISCYTVKRRAVFMKRIVIVFFLGLLTACSMAPLQKTVIPLTPYELKNKSKSISVIKLIDTLEMSKVIGKYYRGLGCFSGGELYWHGSDKLLADVSNIVRNKLEKYGYALIGKANSTFNEEYSKQSDLLLGGKIVDIEANVCSSVHGAKGEVFVKVAWELYDTRTKSVVLAVTTEGYSSAKDFTKTADKDLYVKGFDMATDNLLADKAFYSLLTSEQ
jgi:hypothetical protein